MLTNDRERRIHEKYSQSGPDGLVNCNSCPLVKDERFCMCKANSHYDRSTKSWELDEMATLQDFGEVQE